MSEDAGWAGLPDGEPVTGKSYRADGWVYRDTDGWFDKDGWFELLGIIGEGNYVILAHSVRGGKDYRGQFLISPIGMDRMKEWAKGKAP